MTNEKLIMNINKNNDEIDLGLTLGSTNYCCVNSSSNKSSGAGVNANSRLDTMGFAASDPLSELVWSPRNGMSFKCVHSGLAINKPHLLWNVGPSSQSLSTPPIVGAQRSGDENIVDEENRAISQPILNKATLVSSFRSNPSPVLGASHEHCDAATESSCKDQDAADNVDAVHKEESSKGNEVDRLCSSQNAQIADIGEFSKRSSGQDTFPDGMNRQFSNTQVTLATEELNNDRTRPPFLATPLNKLEFSGENDLDHMTRSLSETKLSREKSFPVEISTTNSGIRLYRIKGKEKALSDGNILERSSNDEDDSQESVESCNSAGLFAKGIKRQNCDQDLIVESKRMKPSYGSSSIFGPGSSFVNWISNMVKGLSDSTKEESSLQPLSLFRPDGKKNLENSMHGDSANISRGFQTMFKSMYHQDTKKSENAGEKDKELMVADNSKYGDLPRSRGIQIHNSCKLIDISNEAVNPYISRDTVCHQTTPLRLCSDFASTSYAHENNFSENKASIKLVCTSETGGVSPCDTLPEPVTCTVDDTDPDTPLVTSNVPKKGNPLTSLWITRLYTRSSKENIGITDNAAENEMGQSAANDEAYVDLNSSSKLIPILPSLKLRSSEAMVSVFARRLDALRQSEPNSSSPHLSYLPSYLDRNVKKSSSKRSAASDEILKRNGSNSENYFKDHQKFPICSVTPAEEQCRVAPAEVFQAIRKLRLSRTDVLRWINSNTSLSNLNGFFLRLRLGKLEAELGGTGYYVACITSDIKEHVGLGSNKSILVSVGGIKSSVGSQYISNHDFLEDEINVWWRRTVKAGGKIPSLDELNLKFEDKTSLGF